MENKIIQQVKRKKDGKKTAIFIILACVAFCLLVFFIWLYIGKIKQGSEDVFLAKSSLSLSEIQEREIEEFKINYENNKEDFQRIDEAIFDAKNPLDFIEFLENSADEENLGIVISPISPSQMSEFKTIAVQISVTGDFSGILRFINRLENGHYLISLENLIIKEAASPKTGRVSATGMIQANLTVNVLVKQ